MDREVIASTVTRLRAAPVRERLRLPNWVVAVRDDVGLGRDEMQDAHRILPEAVFLGRTALALGVFDGLGGESNGRAAALAAATHLPEALAKVSGAQNVLGYLNAWVRQSQGLTTGLVGLFPEAGGEGWILSLGDSGAYVLGPMGSALPVNPKDSDGKHGVTQCLGMPEVDGHVLPLRIERGQALLLCTDGVDVVAGLDSITRALRAPDVAAAAEDLLADVFAHGAPDNATVVIARRTA